jgi:hypothetical protein
MTLPLFDEWRKRWLVTPRGSTLHRVSSISWDDEDEIAGFGTTACAKFALLRMPGLLSRMYAPRCRLCCLVAGVPTGDGAPFNAGIEEGKP